MAQLDRRGQSPGRKASDAEALGWWTKPGVLVFLATLALALAGWGLVIHAGRRIPVEEASVEGLELHLEEARWVLDQMDHGENFQKPAMMMPDMPGWGQQRLTVDVTFRNRSGELQRVDAREFSLVPELGDAVGPLASRVARFELAPGQSLNTIIPFDFDTTPPHGKLKVEWRRRGRSVFLPIPEPAEHVHLRPRQDEVVMPPDARLVTPLGDAERGQRLFTEVYGCSACHGDPRVPGSNNVGPHLGRIGDLAASRIPGMPADQYIYESILTPNKFIAPDCKNGPCASPTAMPEFASLMSLQDVADLVDYLLSLKGS